ncbi:hypothetical protein [Microcoleus sp. bin38.metabat.b11b12b14.051]|uniref:hypothetical protein n=1 Tax=Microcoleus sp. bin38.metabat.b11b12b14.051 TaxID=2742709 RepID=UPI0025D820F7|nr:hypothetical protein [Microcoleus sp. bin38.metabat.b11b12b14.051]
MLQKWWFLYQLLWGKLFQARQPTGSNHSQTFISKAFKLPIARRNIASWGDRPSELTVALWLHMMFDLSRVALAIIQEPSSVGRAEF